jgi:branched-chain amino acid transport system substrate-binding protein
MKGVVSLILAVAIVAAAMLVSCRKAENVASYRVGVTVAQTGQYAGLGLQALDGLQLQAEEVNAAGGIDGVPLELIIYDDKSDATEATLAAKKLIEIDQVHVLASATATGMSLSLVPVANESKVPTVILTGTTLQDDKLGSWVFRPTGTEASYVTLDLGYLRDKLGISKYATLIENSAFGDGGKAFLPRMSPDYGLTIVAEQYFDPGATDLTPQLTNIKNSGAEAIFLWGGTPTATLAIKQAREMDISLPILGTPPNVSPDLMKQFGEYFEMAPSFVASTSKFEVWQQLPDSDVDKAKYANFSEKFVAKYGHPASMWALLGGQFIQFIEDGLKRANAESSELVSARSQIRDAFEKTNQLQLYTGVYTMSPKNHFGQTAWRMVLVTFKDGKKLLVP